MSRDSRITIRRASIEDVPLVLGLIKELAEFERIPHEVSATEEIVRESLFGENPAAEALLAECGGQARGIRHSLQKLFDVRRESRPLYRGPLREARVPRPRRRQGALHALRGDRARAQSRKGRMGGPRVESGAGVLRALRRPRDGRLDSLPAQRGRPALARRLLKGRTILASVDRIGRIGTRKEIEMNEQVVSYITY